MGRPSIYNKELVTEICLRLASGKSLRTVCAQDDMPPMGTVFRWIHDIPEFREQYARAKQESSDALAEDIIDIADENTDDWMTIGKGDNKRQVPDREVVERSKLRVETRKWIMAKMKPKKYGDKIDVTSGGEKLPTPILSGASVAPVTKPTEK